LSRSMNLLPVSRAPSVVEEGVMFVAEVAARLRMSVKQVYKLEALRRFPIPRLPRLDRHARYSRAVVEAFVEGRLRSEKKWGR
jgi:predicted DNA-binding transcriptional regulator AlpA